ESAKDMTPLAVPAKNSVITKDFVDAITEIGVKLVAEAEKSYKAINPTLRPHTPQEALALMADGGEYFESMREQYGREDDIEFNEKVFATILGSGNEEEAVEEANALREEDEAQEETTAAKKEKAVKTEKKAESKKVETKKEEESTEVEDDD
ncbi:hypothetical protein, partial [Bacillus mycoides]|uniref:hypothetical protein n=1 Tax=Bacillus mycoides TaxID=1405 RepID=UPI003A7F7EB6